MRALDAPLGAVRLGNDGDRIATTLDARHPSALEQIDSLGAQPRAHHVDQLGVVVAHQGEHLDDCHARAEPAKRLGEFGANRPAADDHQMLGRLGQPKHRLIGQERCLVESRDRRHHRPAAGCHDEAPRAHFDVARLNSVLAGETTVVLDDVHAEPFEALDRVVWRDAGDDVVDMVVDGGEIDRRLDAVDAEPPGAANALGGVAGGEQRLGRYTAMVETVAAHCTAFDERRLGAIWLAPAATERPPEPAPMTQMSTFNSRAKVQDPPEAPAACLRARIHL